MRGDLVRSRMVRAKGSALIVSQGFPNAGEESFQSWTMVIDSQTVNASTDLPVEMGPPSCSSRSVKMH
jgi:hypothetical protein